MIFSPVLEINNKTFAFQRIGQPKPNLDNSLSILLTPFLGDNCFPDPKVSLIDLIDRSYNALVPQGKLKDPDFNESHNEKPPGTFIS